MTKSDPLDSKVGDDAQNRVVEYPKYKYILIFMVVMNEAISMSILYPYVGLLIVHLRPGMANRDAGTVSGLVTGSFQIAQAVLGPRVGRLSDQVGRRPILALGLIASAVMSICFGLASTVWQLILFRALYGLCNANAPLTKVMVAEMVGPKTEAFGWSMMGAGWAAGTAIGPSLGGLLYDPASTFPGTFRGTIFERCPGLLPALFSASYAVFSMYVVMKHLPETNVNANPPRWMQALGFKAAPSQNTATARLLPPPIASDAEITNVAAATMPVMAGADEGMSAMIGVSLDAAPPPPLLYNGGDDDQQPVLHEQHEQQQQQQDGEGGLDVTTVPASQLMAVALTASFAGANTPSYAGSLPSGAATPTNLSFAGAGAHHHQHLRAVLQQHHQQQQQLQQQTHSETALASAPLPPQSLLSAANATSESSTDRRTPDVQPASSSPALAPARSPASTPAQPNDAAAATAGAASAPYGIGTMLSDPRMFKMLAVYVMIAWGNTSFNEVFPLLAITPVAEGGLGLNAAAIGVIFFLYALEDVLGSVLFTLALKVCTRASLLRWSYVVVGVSVLLHGALPAGNWNGNTSAIIAAAGLASIVRVVASTFIFSVALMGIAAAAPKRHLGMATGVSHSCSNLARATMPAIMTFLFSYSIGTTTGGEGANTGPSATGGASANSTMTVVEESQSFWGPGFPLNRWFVFILMAAACVWTAYYARRLVDSDFTRELRGAGTTASSGGVAAGSDKESDFVRDLRGVGIVDSAAADVPALEAATGDRQHNKRLSSDAVDGSSRTGPADACDITIVVTSSSASGFDGPAGPRTE